MLRQRRHRPARLLFAAIALTAAGCGSSSDPLPSAPPNDDAAADGSAPPGGDDPAAPDAVAEPGENAASDDGEIPPVDADAASPLAYVGYVGVVRTTPTNSLLNGAPLPGTPARATGSALLTRLAEPFTLAEYLEGRREERDRCTRYVDGVAVEGALVGVTGDTSAFVSGGEVLTMRSPAGSYAELLSTSTERGVSYDLGGLDSLPLPVPSGLTVDIPGAEFPALSDIRVPDADPLAVLGDPSQDPLSREFRWVPGGNPSAIVQLIVTTTSSDFTSNGFLCSAIDDGEFTAPEWAAALLDADATTAVRTVQRETYALTVDGDTLVVGSTLTPFNAIVN